LRDGSMWSYAYPEPCMIIVLFRIHHLLFLCEQMKACGVWVALQSDPSSGAGLRSSVRKRCCSQLQKMEWKSPLFWQRLLLAPFQKQYSVAMARRTRQHWPPPVSIATSRRASSRCVNQPPGLDFSSFHPNQTEQQLSRMSLAIRVI
jgi:hypothetical protein